MTISKPTAHPIEWDWADDGSSLSADLGAGGTALVSFTLDGDCWLLDDLGDFYTDDDYQHLTVWLAHSVVTLHGAVILDGYLGGIVMDDRASVSACRAYVEDIAAEMVGGAPSAAEVACLMLGVQS